MEELSLRRHQAESVRKVWAAWKAGHRSICLCMPTGSGKRYLALWFCQFAERNNRRVLLTGNRRLLITQAAGDAQRFDIGHGSIMANFDEGDADHTTQFASIHTLESRCMYEKWSNIPTGFGLPPADLVIPDECHQDLARYQRILGFYPDSKVLGLTATPVGPNGVSLIPRHYDCLVEGAKNSELIRDKFLLPTRVFCPSEPNIEGVRVQNGEEYNQRQLGRAVKECTVFGDVFKEWERFSDRATVCFVPGVAFGRDIAQQFNKRLGSGAAHLIEAKTKYDERQQIFDLISSGRSCVLVSVDVLREGFDLPVLSCSIDLQPNSQFRSYWQKVGRIKRAFAGQSDAILLDFAGNYWKYPHPNEDPEWPIGEETTQDVIERNRKEGKEKQPIECPGCGEAFTPRGSPPTCPNCGHQINSAPIRRVRMGDGRLKEVPAYKKEKKLKTEAEIKFDQWKGVLWAGMKLGWSISRCQNVHKYKYGHYPSSDMPYADTPGMDSRRLLKHVTSASGLMSELNEYREMRFE